MQMSLPQRKVFLYPDATCTWYTAQRGYHLQLVQVFLVVVVGAFLQANIGFGFPIIAMIFLPSLYPFSTAVTLNQVIAMASTGYLAVRYHRYIAWKILLPLLATSVAVAQLVILFSLSVDSKILGVALGVFLLLLSLYFAFFSERITIKATVGNGLLMGLIAGVGNGFFGIGGPPVALYLFASVKDKRVYLSTIQAYFLFCNIHSILVRTTYGSLTKSHIPPILVGWAAIGVGTYLGLLLFKRVSDTTLRRIVYLFVGCAGIWIGLQPLL